MQMENLSGEVVLMKSLAPLMPVYMQSKRWPLYVQCKKIFMYPVTFKTRGKHLEKYFSTFQLGDNKANENFMG